MYFNSIATVLGLVASVNAHMLLAFPPPFPGNENGPLGDGRVFPCQGKMTGGTPTAMALGSTQKLTFQGGATHGGGSCQIALTNEKNPNAQTKFRVITSIHGGCPMNSNGNNGNDASAALDTGLQFKVPSDIPEGSYTLAWTWINRIGNREFYMNCAPVTLTGTGGPQSNLDKLPEIFVTNSPSSNTCQTPEGSDYIFPNPGPVVFEKGDKSRLIKLQCPANTPGGQAGAQPAPESGSSQGEKPNADAPTNPSNGIKLPVSGDKPAADRPANDGNATPTTTQAPVAKPTAPSAPSTPTNGSNGNKGSENNSGAGSGSGSSSGGACTPGQFKCVDGKSFQQCTAGQVWAAKIDMAAGTKCDSGAVSTTLYSLTKRGVSFRA